MTHRAIRLLYIGIIVLLSSSQECLASKLRGSPRQRRQRQQQITKALGKTNGNGEPKEGGKKDEVVVEEVSAEPEEVVEDIFDTEEEEELFFTTEESEAEEAAVEEEPTVEETTVEEETSSEVSTSSGLGEMEGQPTIEHNSEKEKAAKGGPEKEPRSGKDDKKKDSVYSVEYESYDDPEENAAYKSFDDPEAPVPTASPTVAESEPLAEDKTLPETGSVTLPVENDSNGNTNEADTMFGGSMVEEPARPFAGGYSNYQVKEELVPVDTTINEQPANEHEEEESTQLNRGSIFAFVAVGCLVFAVLTFLGLIGPQKQYHAAKQFELFFHGGHDKAMTDMENNSGPGRRHKKQPNNYVMTQSDSFTLPNATSIDDVTSTHNEEGWDDTSDPWSYDGNDSPRVPSIGMTKHQGSPIGQRISNIIEGTITASKRKIKKARGDYEGFDQSSQCSGDHIFEDVEEDPMSRNFDLESDASTSEVEARLAQVKRSTLKLSNAEESIDIIEEKPESPKQLVVL